MRVVCVAGARPNFVKVKPVVDALERRRVDVTLVHTGQHYDPLMSSVFFDELGLRPPDHHLETGSGSHAGQTAAVMTALEPLVEATRPDVVVVVGDVNSTLAAALVAAKSPARLAHVEAGLRSRDWTMPEEVNRVVTDRLSDFLFAPSQDAVDNLAAEGLDTDRIHLVGNVMIDTLYANLDRARSRPTLRDLAVEPSGYAVLTLHRPTNVDDPTVLKEILVAVSEVAAELPVIFPLHPRARRPVEALPRSERVRVVDPLGYLDFLALEAQARVVLTDSGGVQEETTVLGIPCVTVRETTERPITVTHGTNVIGGTDAGRIVSAVRRALDRRVEATAIPLWDGRASERIAGVLVGS